MLTLNASSKSCYVVLKSDNKLVLPSITIPSSQECCSHPSLGALIPNTSCATDPLQAGLYLLSAQLPARFAPAAWLGTTSITAALKAGSSQRAHTILMAPLSEHTIICGDVQLFSDHLGIRFNCDPKTDFITFQLNGAELCFVINLEQSTDYKASI